MALHVVLQVPTLSEDDGPLDEHVRHLKPCGVSSGIVRDVVEAVGASLGKPVRDSLFVSNRLFRCLRYMCLGCWEHQTLFRFRVSRI